MKICPPLLLTVVLFGWTCGHSAAAPPQAASVKVRTQTGTSYVSILKEGPGRRVLVINYPWRVHAKPSVEVRLVTKEDADPSGIRPLFFVKDYLKGQVLLDVYRSQDEGAGAGASRGLRENQIDLKILGRRNSLGKPSVCAARKAPSDGPAPGAVAAFCLLPSWSINKSWLQLDLPREYFAEPGKLYVWFLRDGRVLWEETENWPGITH